MIINRFHLVGHNLVVIPKRVALPKSLPEDIDVAFLPVNHPYTMTGEQCVKAAKVSRPRVLILYHFSQTDLSSLPSLLPGIKVLLREME